MQGVLVLPIVEIVHCVGKPHPHTLTSFFKLAAQYPHPGHDETIWSAAVLAKLRFVELLD